MRRDATLATNFPKDRREKLAYHQGVFTQLAEDLFTLEQELRFRFGLTLLTRMTVIRRGRKLWVHSPLPGPKWYEGIRKLGDVTMLVAPSCHHSLFIADAKRQFPSAVLAAPSQLMRARPELAVDRALTTNADPHEAWPSGVVTIPVLGAPTMSEHLFYDSQSRSLIVTDLVFDNARGSNWITRRLLGLFAPTGRPVRSKEWDWWLIKDRAAFANSLSTLSTLAIDRIVGAHGRIMADVPLAISIMKTGRPPTAQLAASANGNS